jgi:hypothetical protein
MPPRAASVASRAFLDIALAQVGKEAGEDCLATDDCGGARHLSSGHTSRRMHRSKQHLYSITSSARASSMARHFEAEQLRGAEAQFAQ